jgi:hypothetical protein
MHDGGAGGGGSIPGGGHMPGGGHTPGGGHMPAHHPGQFSHGPTHHHGHDNPAQVGYDQSGSMAGITPSGRLSRRQGKATALSVIAVIVIIFIVLLVI